MKEENNDSASTGLEKNLLLLLRSEQEKDVRLGLHLAQNPEIKLRDLTDLIAVALFHRKADLRELGEMALMRHATQEERTAIARDWEPTHRQGDHKPFFSAVGRLAKLSRVNADLLHRLAVRYTWRFPEKMAHTIPEAFLEYCEANISPYYSLNLSGKAIPVLPPEIGKSAKLRTLQDLSLNSCDLKRIPDEIAKLQQLTSLDLTNNKLKDLPRAIGKLSRLRKLYWTQNDIPFIPACVPDLKQLEQLRLRIGEGFDYTGLEQCRQIRSLDLTLENGAGPFHKGFLALNQVEDLQLNARAWKHTLPDEVEQLDRLKTIRLTLYPEHPFPTFTRRLPRLQSLNLSMVTKWEAGAATVPQAKLKNLSLSIGLWKEWPEDWCDFPQLEVLELRAHKRLEHFPSEFAQLSNLTHLSLYNVGLKFFPDVFLELPGLQILSIVNSHITELPEDLGRLSNLRELHLAGSEIRHLPHSLRNLKQLRLLELRNLKLNRHEVKQLAADMPWTRITWN